MGETAINFKNIYTQNKLTISYELFPPKTWGGMAHLFEHFKVLMSCNPAFVTCTYGAGGSSRDRTLEVLRYIHRDYPDIPIASHLTCVGSSVDELKRYIDTAVENGISALVALRGDPPKDQANFQPVPGGFAYASELVEMVKKDYPQLGVLVAGYPEKHPEAASFEADIEHLKHKVACGADAIITQMFYDNVDFFRFRDKCDQAGITVPIVPGLLPVTNLAQIQKISTLCGARLPLKLVQRLEAHENDDEGQYAVGVYYCTRQAEELVDQGVPGMHFYVLNKSRAASLICRALVLDVA